MHILIAKATAVKVTKPLQHLFDRALFCPRLKVAVTALIGWKFPRQHMPGRTATQNSDNSFDHFAGIAWRAAFAVLTSFWFGQYNPQLFPFRIAESIGRLHLRFSNHSNKPNALSQILLTYF